MGLVSCLVSGLGQSTAPQASPFSSTSSSSAPWQLGGVSLSRASTASYKTSRIPSPLSLARASPSSDKKSESPPSSDSSTGTNLLLPPEDVGYVMKLTFGSVAGAAAVKYGSLFLPNITRPNLLEALLIMGSPVIVAVAWLTVASLKEVKET